MTAVRGEVDSSRPSSRICTEPLLLLQPSASKPIKPASIFTDSVQKDFDRDTAQNEPAIEIPDSPVSRQCTKYSNVSKRWARDTEFKVLLRKHDSLPVKHIRGPEHSQQPKRKTRTECILPNHPCATLARQIKPTPLNESVQITVDSENANKESLPSTPDSYPDTEPVTSRSPKSFNVLKPLTQDAAVHDHQGHFQVNSVCGQVQSRLLRRRCGTTPLVATLNEDATNHPDQPHMSVPAIRPSTGNAVSEKRMVLCEQTSFSQPTSPRSATIPNLSRHTLPARPSSVNLATWVASSTARIDESRLYAVQASSSTGMASGDTATVGDADAGFDTHNVPRTSRSNFSAKAPPSEAPPGRFIRAQGKQVVGRDTAVDSLLQNLDNSCIDCGTSLASAPRCLTCGGTRVDAVFDELFDIFAMSRVTMRQAMLPKFHKKVEHFRKSLEDPSKTKKSTRKQMLQTAEAYNEAFSIQVNSGCKYHQGLTREFFPAFLKLVAQSLNLTLRSFLHGMASQETSQERLVEQSTVHVEVQRDALQQRCASSCDETTTRSGTSSAQEKAQPEQDYHQDAYAFGGTRRARLGLPEADGQIQQEDFAQLVRLSQAHHIPLSEVRRLWKEFQEYDINKDRVLQRDEFTTAVCERFNLPADDDVVKGLLMHHWFKTTPQEGEFVDLEAFLIWSIGTAYVLERAVEDPNERFLRTLASQLGVRQDAFDGIKKAFDKSGVDRCGFLTESSFKQAALRVARARNIFSDATLKSWWKEANLKYGKHEGRIDFQGFLCWCMQKWPAHAWGTFT